jgi:ATP-binding cassette, subfamily F, member 3
MITLTGLAIRRGTKLLFDNVSCTIAKAEKVGLVGANGSGKTSLFQLIIGQMDADTGSVDLPATTRIAYMAQEVPLIDDPAIDYVLSGDADYMSISRKLEAADADGVYDDMAELHEQMASVDGYAAPARAAQLMIGLGFAQEELQQPVSAFSGGWQIRLNLARTLMKPSDLLLLDEPTNHLDLDAILWLSSWIKRYTGTLFLISHDRTFLDECVNRIAYIHLQTIELFPGNYSQFEMLKAARLAEQQSNYTRQQREIHHMQDFVRRFRAKATKARQAQSRLKALGRMELIAPAHIDSPFRFAIPSTAKISDPLLSLDLADLGYDSTILSTVKISLHPGDRIGLLGHNGAGKSTLIKSLTGDIDILSGERTEGINLRTAYFSQQQVDNLSLQQSAFQHIQQLDMTRTEQQVRDYLGGYDFHGDKVKAVVSTFSGGEKARLALAMVAYQKPNLLLMDEPTNHLDMDMCQALTVALQEFDGAIVLISHDRHLLANTVDEFLLIDNGTVQVFDGDLTDYRNRIFRDKPEVAVTSEDVADVPTPSRAPDHKAARQLKTRIRTLEKSLERLQRKLAEVDGALAQPEIYQRDGNDHDSRSLQQLLRDQLSLKEEIEEQESEWLEQSTLLESLS